MVTVDCFSALSRFHFTLAGKQRLGPVVPPPYDALSRLTYLISCRFPCDFRPVARTPCWPEMSEITKMVLLNFCFPTEGIVSFKLLLFHSQSQSLAMHVGVNIVRIKMNFNVTYVKEHKHDI